MTTNSRYAYYNLTNITCVTLKVQKMFQLSICDQCSFSNKSDVLNTFYLSVGLFLSHGLHIFNLGLTSSLSLVLSFRTILLDNPCVKDSSATGAQNFRLKKLKNKFFCKNSFFKKNFFEKFVNFFRCCFEGNFRPGCNFFAVWVS